MRNKKAGEFSRNLVLDKKNAEVYQNSFLKKVCLEACFIFVFLTADPFWILSFPISSLKVRILDPWKFQNPKVTTSPLPLFRPRLSRVGFLGREKTTRAQKRNHDRERRGEQFFIRLSHTSKTPKSCLSEKNENDTTALSSLANFNLSKHNWQKS